MRKQPLAWVRMLQFERERVRVSDRKSEAPQGIRGRLTVGRGSARIAFITAFGLVLAAALIVGLVYAVRRSFPGEPPSGPPRPARSGKSVWQGIVPESIVEWILRADESLVGTHVRYVPGAYSARPRVSGQLQKGLYISWLSDSGLDSRLSVQLFGEGLAESVEELRFFVHAGERTQEAKLLYTRAVELPEPVRAALRQKGCEPTANDAVVAYLSCPPGLSNQESLLVRIQRAGVAGSDVSVRLEPEWRPAMRPSFELRLVGHVSQMEGSMRSVATTFRKYGPNKKFACAGSLLEYFFAVNVPAESKMKLLGWIEELPDSHLIVSPTAKRTIERRWGHERRAKTTSAAATKAARHAEGEPAGRL